MISGLASMPFTIGMLPAGKSCALNDIKRGWRIGEVSQRVTLTFAKIECEQRWRNCMDYRIWSNSSWNNFLSEQEFMRKCISMKPLDPESFGIVIRSWHTWTCHQVRLNSASTFTYLSYTVQFYCDERCFFYFAPDRQWKYAVNIGRPIRCVYIRYLKILSNPQMFGTLSPFAHWNSHWTFLLYHSFDTNHWRGVSVLVYTEGRMFAPVCIVPTQTVVF
jgi:hypothetical protein